MIVVDSSALVDLLIDKTARGQAVAVALDADPTWAAPQHLLVEVAHVLRKRVIVDQALSEGAGAAAVAALAAYAFTWVELDAALLARVWKLRDNLTAYDAAYVAAAERLGCPLVTVDAKLAKGAAAAGAHCRVVVPGSAT